MGIQSKEDLMSSYEDFSMQLFQADSYEESFQAYNNYLQAMGYHSLSYVFMPDSPYEHHQKTIPRFSVSEGFSQEFLQEYEARQFQKDDYIVDAVNNGESKKLYLWSRDYKNKIVMPEQRVVLDTARYDYEMGNGFSILTAKGTNGTGAVSIVGDDADSARSFAQNIEEHSNRLQMATDYFHSHIVTGNYEVAKFIMPAVFSELKKTEMEVLKCLLKGLSVPHAAERVHRSKRHVENLVRDIRIKVGGELLDGKPRISKDELIHFCGVMRVFHEL